MCDVCKADLKLAPDIYSEDEDELVHCPTCKINFIFAEETVCASCRAKAEALGLALDVEPEVEAEDEWRSFLDEEKEGIAGSGEAGATGEIEDDAEMLSLNKLLEDETEENDEIDKEEAYDFGGSFDYDDDFEEVSDDDLSEDDDEDDDDDDDEDDE